MDVFIILQFVEVYASTANNFRVKARRGKQQYYKKRKQVRYLTLLTF